MGLWALFTTIMSMVETIKIGLLRNATIKFLHEPGFEEVQRKQIQSASLIINIGFTILVILLIILFGQILANILQVPKLYFLLLISIPAFLLQIVFNHCDIVQQAHMQYPPIFKATIIRQGVYFLGVVILFFFFKSQQSRGQPTDQHHNLNEYIIYLIFFKARELRNQQMCLEYCKRN